MALGPVPKDTKAEAFAQKVGKILANRYGELIDEHLEGYLEAEDTDTFLMGANVAIREDLCRVLHLTVEHAIAIRQGGDEE